MGLGEEDVFGADVCGAAADAAVCSAREMQERLSRQFRALDEAGEVEAMVKVGALLAKLTGAEAKSLYGPEARVRFRLWASQPG